MIDIYGQETDVAMEEFKTEFSKCEGEQPQGGTGEMSQETGDYNPPAGEVTVSNGTL